MDMDVKDALKSLRVLLAENGKHYKEPICGGLVRTKDSPEIWAAPFLNY